MSAWSQPTEPRLIPTFAVDKGEPIIAANCIDWYVHPVDAWLQEGKGRLPLEARYCAGVRELERDRRRHA